MSEPSEIDFSCTDPRALTLAQWLALKAQVRKRAHDERAALLSRVFARMWRWLKRRSARPAPEREEFAPSHRRPLYIGGRA